MPEKAPSLLEEALSDLPARELDWRSVANSRTAIAVQAEIRASQERGAHSQDPQ